VARCVSCRLWSRDMRVEKERRFEDATAHTLAMNNVLAWFLMRSLMACLGNDNSASRSLTRLKDELSQWLVVRPHHRPQPLSSRQRQNCFALTYKTQGRIQPVASRETSPWTSSFVVARDSIDGSTLPRLTSLRLRLYRFRRGLIVTVLVPPSRWRVRDLGTSSFQSGAHHDPNCTFLIMEPFGKSPLCI